jgi:LysM repeat protein
MCNRIISISVFLLLAFSGSINAQGRSQAQLNYIEQYKHIAIREMERASIPASITLAQGLLESESGNSWLAVEGNNHFGLKCGRDWSGETIFKEDDDRNHNGDLVPSCFRKYTSPKESYVAHSDFLHHPNKPWYRPLFDMDITDYKAWAEGLLEAGYATNPKYPELLISLIERYQLQQYDTTDPFESFADLNEENPYINGIPYTLAKAGESIAHIAFRTNVSANHLMKYNDGYENANERLQSGQIIFLKSKKWNNTETENPFHTLKRGETMLYLSQRYGITLFWLNFKNKLKEGMDPAVGSQIKLRGTRVKESPKLATEAEKEQWLPEPESEDYIVWRVDPPRNPIRPVIIELPSRATAPKIELKEPKTVVQTYSVKKGDTLWSISRRYGLTVEAVKNFNNLSGNIINVGQELRVSQ